MGSCCACRLLWSGRMLQPRPIWQYIQKRKIEPFSLLLWKLSRTFSSRIDENGRKQPLRVVLYVRGHYDVNKGDQGVCINRNLFATETLLLQITLRTQGPIASKKVSFFLRERRFLSLSAFCLLRSHFSLRSFASLTRFCKNDGMGLLEGLLL